MAVTVEDRPRPVRVQAEVPLPVQPQLRRPPSLLAVEPRAVAVRAAEVEAGCRRPRRLRLRPRQLPLRLASRPLTQQ